MQGEVNSNCFFVDIYNKNVKVDYTGRTLYYIKNQIKKSGPNKGIWTPTPGILFIFLFDPFILFREKNVWHQVLNQIGF